MITRQIIDQLKPVKPLGEIVEFLDNLRVPVKECDRISGPYPYYGANGQQGTINDFIFDEPLVLLAEDGGFFGDLHKPIAYRVNGKCWVNNHAHVLRPTNGLDIDFLFYHLQFYDVTPFVTGTTRGKLTRGSANQIPIYFPDKKIQRKISSLLNKTSSIIKKRKETQQLADEFLRSTFLEMFGDPVLNTKKWKTEDLKKLTSKIGSGATPRGGSESYKEEGISLIRSLNIYDGQFKYENLAYIDNDQASKLKNVTVENNDVFLNITGASVCRCTIVPDDVLPARVNQHVSIIRSKPQSLNPHFLLYHLVAKNYKAFLYNMASQGGATRQALTKEQLEALKICKPPIDLQNKFGEIVGKTEKLKQKYEQSLEELEKLYSSQKQRAFRGEL